MKKFIYISLIVIFTSAVFTSCTETEIKPTVDTSLNGGGQVDVGKI